jgi:putative N-acetylmannosamine-6-phosphate epimerase
VAVKIEDLRGRVIVSCQPVKDKALDRAEFVVGLALAALEGGAAGVRMESLRNVRAVRAATGAPIIGEATSAYIAGVHHPRNRRRRGAR